MSRKFKVTDTFTVEQLKEKEKVNHVYGVFKRYFPNLQDAEEYVEKLVILTIDDLPAAERIAANRLRREWRLRSNTVLVQRIHEKDEITYKVVPKLEDERGVATHYAEFHIRPLNIYRHSAKVSGL